MKDAQAQPMKLEVFDPPMCCSSGVCGPNVNPQLVQFSATLDWLRLQGVHIERYNPSRQYQAFADNATVVKAISDEGLSCLPLVFVNGAIVSRGEYPSRETLARLAGLDPATVVAQSENPLPICPPINYRNL